MKKESLNVDQAVRERYSAASQAREAALCCPVSYDRKYLEVIPKEVIERDYGCGDPSRYLKKGETVLDLGSGGGKICFIAAQIVGAEGRVIGVDTNDDMLRLARDASMMVSEKIGYQNVEFRKGMIQDLKLDRSLLNQWLSDHPVQCEKDLRELESYIAELKREKVMIADESVDVVVSNCVLNLVDTEKKDQMFSEIYRVLKPGGRAVISDIVADEAVPLELQNDPELWSGCISGAYQEAEFLEAFESAGFSCVSLDKRDAEPWQIVDGIEFRSVTVVAYKPLSEEKDSDCNEALIYKGPFKVVQDDRGQVFLRGERVAVSHEIFEEYTRNDLEKHFFAISPADKIDVEDAPEFILEEGIMLRSPQSTKAATTSSSSCCGTSERDSDHKRSPSGGCC
ncbi:MAG: methyltransferase domain-containing protein [Bdellovibrionota bacterium]